MRNAISFFSGCGGSSLGYKLAGVNVQAFTNNTSDCSIYAKHRRAKFFNQSKEEQLKMP